MCVTINQLHYQTRTQTTNLVGLSSPDTALNFENIDGSYSYEYALCNLLQEYKSNKPRESDTDVENESQTSTNDDLTIEFSIPESKNLPLFISKLVISSSLGYPQAKHWLAVMISAGWIRVVPHTHPSRQSNQNFNTNLEKLGQQVAYQYWLHAAANGLVEAKMALANIAK